MQHQIDPKKKTLTVVVPGDILSTNVDALRTEILALVAPTAADAANWTHLVLDFTTTKMIDSAGLNFLVSLVRTLAARDRKIHAVSLNPNIQRTFKFTRLDQHIVLAPV